MSIETRKMKDKPTSFIEFIRRPVDGLTDLLRVA